VHQYLSRYSMATDASFRDAFRRACSYFPTGTVIVAGVGNDEKSFGFTASTFSAVSFDPAVISIAVARGSAGLQHLRRTGTFSISILSETHADVARRFGTPSGAYAPDVLQCERGIQVPVVPEALAHFVCEIEDALDIGDHCLIIAAVRWFASPGGKPLVYWRRTFFGLRLEYSFLMSGEALDLFVRDWERGTLPLRSWTHSAHIAVTAYYAFDRSSDEVFRAMKQGIINFNICTGTMNGPDCGYHETLTRFWSQIVCELVHNGTYDSRFDAARASVEAFGEDRDRHRLYYSFDVVRDREARRNWIAPDREPACEWSLPNDSIPAQL
jgi:flavin reductase ActVB